MQSSLSLVSIKNATANLKLIIMTKQQNYGTSIIVLFRFSSSNFFILHSLLKLCFGHGHTKNWWSVQLFSNQRIPQQRNFLNEIVLLDFWSYKSNMFWFYNQKCHYTYLSCYLKKQRWTHQNLCKWQLWCSYFIVTCCSFVIDLIFCLLSFHETGSSRGSNSVYIAFVGKNLHQNVIAFSKTVRRCLYNYRIKNTWNVGEKRVLDA